MRNILLSLFLGTALMAAAKCPKGYFTLRPMAGVVVTTFSGADIEDFYHNKLGFTAGLDAEYGLTENIGLSIGALYSQQGAKEDGAFTIFSEDEIYDYWIETKAKGKCKLDYIQFPMMLTFNIPQLKGLSLKTGVQLGVNVKSRMTADIDVSSFAYEKSNHSMKPIINSVSESIDEKVEASKFDFGIPFAVTFEHKWLVVEARYCFGLNKIDRSEMPENVRNRSLSFTVGCRLPLSKKTIISNE